LQTVFTTQDEAYHSQLLRAAGGAYSTTAAAQMEVQMQPLNDLLLAKINELGNKGERSINAATLLDYFAFDAVGQVNMSAPFGFLEKNTDVNNAIDAVTTINTYLSVIGQAPWLHKLFLGNGISQRLVEPNNIVQNMAIQMINNRISGQQKVEGHDLVARLLEVSEKDPSKLNTSQIVALTTTNVLAGSATVAMALRSILYHLSRNREALATLQKEIDDAFSSGALSQPPLYTEATKLKYLEAAVTEAMRMNPGTGLMLERVAPAGGVSLCGKHIPEGTIVGINSWVMHANTSVYGADANVYRPERWLDSDEKRVREMRRCHMAVSLPIRCYKQTMTN
jgi:hypothetical protein